MTRRVLQIQSSSASLDQILCGLKNQMLMLLSSTIKYFSYPERVYPGPSLIEFCLKGNNKSKSVSKMVVQSRS